MTSISADRVQPQSQDNDMYKNTSRQAKTATSTLCTAMKAAPHDDNDVTYRTLALQYTAQAVQVGWISGLYFIVWYPVSGRERLEYVMQWSLVDRTQNPV